MRCEVYRGNGAKGAIRREQRWVGHGFRVPDSRENFKSVRSICTVASGLVPPIRGFFLLFRIPRRDEGNP